jgi:hypothetical protein
VQGEMITKYQVAQEVLVEIIDISHLLTQP